MSDIEEYQWTFEVTGDVIKFEETTITVFTPTYEEAVRKIKRLKIPSLRTFDDLEDGIRLTSVFEITGTVEDEEEPEPIDG